MREDLSRFEFDILTVLAAKEPRIGLDIKESLEDRYGAEINHGRLYPRLDDLKERGLVEKRQGPDERSNHYRLTTAGVNKLEERYTWVRSNVEATFDIRQQSSGAWTFREV